LLHCLRGERAVQTEIIRRIREGEMPIDALSEGGKPYLPGAPPTPISPWGRLMFDSQQAFALEWTNRLNDIAKRPDFERPPLLQALEAEVDRTRRSRIGVWAATIPMLMMPAASVPFRAEARYHANLGSMAILLAAERHRLKAGDWPDSIAAIDPTFLPAAPVDPFSGRPFRVERRDGQFLVYSVGPNGKDEHGTIDPASWMRKELADDYGTGAWDVPLRRQPPAPGVESPA
jgi:hypothetical protein